jgi:phage tail sheath protein FI
MAGSFRTPGVFVQEVPSGVRSIHGVNRAQAAFVGWSTRGPVDEALVLRSWSDYEHEYGSLAPQSLLGYAVKHFFMNGGTEALVARITGDDPAAAIEPDTPDFEAALHGADRGLDLLAATRDGFDVLSVPGETNPLEIQQLQQFCANHRAFLIVDSPPDADVATLSNGPDPALLGPDAANSALYFPWLFAPDPLQGGGPRSFPPSGFVAGVIARTDRQRGVWKAPAGTEATVMGVTGPVIPLDDAAIHALNPLAVNGIRSMPQRGTLVWGSRTLEGVDTRQSDWKYIPVRRTALFIEESIHRGIEWAVFEPNDEPLWMQLREAVEVFLDGLFREGAFQGEKASDAYFVRCDRETTTQADMNRGIVNVMVGFAPLKPAEFVVLKIEQMAGQTR